jgi:transmembrane protein EpsG
MANPVISGFHNSFSNLVPIKPAKVFIVLAVLTLSVISGLRNNIGDTFYYMYGYEINDFSWGYIFANKDFGFSMLQRLLKSISHDPQILILTTAIISNVLVVTILYRYSRLIELSLFVYITGGLYLVSMNGIRQFLAASILFAATKFILKGDWKKYMLVVLFAATLHQSALILIPIYFFVRQKAWSSLSYLFILSAVVVVIGYQEFSSFLFSAMETTVYGHYSEFAEGGANFIRVGVSAFPLLIAYLGRDKFKEIFPASDVIINFSLISLVFTIVSTQNWIFARFNMYFDLYTLILISWLPKLFREKDGRVIYYFILLAFFVFYFYENVLTLKIIYQSDFIS